jgi:hypothetical protein
MDTYASIVTYCWKIVIWIFVKCLLYLILIVMSQFCFSIYAMLVLNPNFEMT